VKPDSRMIFGFCLLFVLAALIAVIALGKVEDATSAGLKELIGGLLVLAGGFANYAFGNRTEKPAEKETKPE
jgi:Flp pilus assembly protein protease CpaA